MAASVNFGSEIKELKARLKQSKKDLKSLQARENKQLAQIANIRDSLDNLHKTVVKGQTLTPEERNATNRVGLTPLDINSDSGRPSRGKRREQIEQAAKKVGRGGKVFRTIELLHALEEVEGELSAGVKSYTYSMLKEFENDGVLEKVGHGKWKKIK